MRHLFHQRQAGAVLDAANPARRARRGSSAGFDYLAGLEVEFHLFKLENPRLAPEDATWPPRAPEVSLLNQGYQYLTESRFDQIETALAPIRRGVAALGLPLRSLEIELGPSQCEFTFRPQRGLDAADAMILFRTATKQIARRNGLLASFMCRPALPNVFSSGWHLHQSLTDRNRDQRVCGRRARRPLALGRISGRPLGARAGRVGVHHADRQWLQALSPYTLAPDRAIWARDNRGVMVRVLGQPGDPSTHLENRVGEPAANPYLYMASQIHAGLDGIARAAIPGPRPTRRMKPRRRYCRRRSATRSPRCGDAVFRNGFGDGFVDYYAHLKGAEFARFKAEESAGGDVTAWEHDEYFDLF